MDADRLADHLGDLPLAVVQAAGFIAETGMPAAEYLQLLGTQADRLLEEGTPESYPRSLAAATRLAAERLGEEDSAAARLAGLCAFFGPEPIPERLFTAVPAELSQELALPTADPLLWRQTLWHLTRPSLVRVDQRGLVMHRLTQAILRDRLTSEERDDVRNQSSEMTSGTKARPSWQPATPTGPRIPVHGLGGHR